MENHKTTAVATDRADSNVQVMEKSQTAKAIETANKENAGFRDVTGTEVTVTVPCFGFAIVPHLICCLVPMRRHTRTLWSFGC